MLEEDGITPCNVVGFTTTNDCAITNRDTILFFNTRRENYDGLITAILSNAKEVFKEEAEFRIVKIDDDYLRAKIG